MTDLSSSESKRERLPPGQEEKEDFPVLSKDEIPEIPSEWRIKLCGKVEEEKDFGLEEIKDFSEVTSQVLDFHCVTGWSKLGIEWKGIKFKDLIKRAGIESDGEEVMFHALDGYTTNLPLDVCMQDDVMIVWEYDGKEIPPEHGGPVRTVIESKYAYKGAKWLTKIEILESHERGYWEQRGYSDTADPWKEDRYSD